MKKLATIATLLALASPFALAEEKKGKKEKPSPEEAFKKLDTNGDGKLSEEEFVTGKKDAEKAKAQFKSLDKDSDGSLTLEEFSAPAGGKKKKE